MRAPETGIAYVVRTVERRCGPPTSIVTRRSIHSPRMPVHTQHEDHRDFHRAADQPGEIPARAP